jgi:hypothetical protein
MITLKKAINAGRVFIIQAAALIALAACGGGTSGGSTPPPESAVPGGGSVGGDWRTWRGYTSDYIISDELTVTFSGQTDEDFYCVYDAAGGNRIGTLLFEDGHLVEDAQSEDFLISDADGDGDNDVGVTLKDGAVMWFAYDPENLGTWPDNISGCFSYLRTDGASGSDGTEPPIEKDALPEGVTYRAEYALEGDPGEGLSAGGAAKELFYAVLYDWEYNEDFFAGFTRTQTGIVVTWKNNSALIANLDDRTQREEFHFFDADSLRWFMMDSLYKTLKENFPNEEVFYEAGGGVELRFDDLEFTNVFPADVPYMGSAFYAAHEGGDN